MDDGFGASSRHDWLSAAGQRLDREAGEIIAVAEGDMLRRGLAAQGFHPAIYTALQLADRLIDAVLEFDDRVAAHELARLRLTGKCNAPFGAEQREQLIQFIDQWIVGTISWILEDAGSRRLWSGGRQDEQHQIDLRRHIVDAAKRRVGVEYGQRSASFGLDSLAIQREAKAAKLKVDALDRRTRHEATATRKPRRTARVLSDREVNFLKALLQLRAFDEQHRKSRRKVVRHLLGNPNATDRDAGQYAEVVASLVKRRHVATWEGRGGGCWLTPSGRKRAEKL